MDSVILVGGIIDSKHISEIGNISFLFKGKRKKKKRERNNILIDSRRKKIQRKAWPV
jgi:hypothetical protein